MEGNENNPLEKTVGKINFVGLALCLCSSMSVHAAPKPMSDADLSQVTGQAGITIDINTDISFSELAYQDQGYLAIQDFTWGGADRSGATGASGSFENWRMIIDVKGASETLDFGFSDVGDYGITPAQGIVDAEYAGNDGDLVIHNVGKDRLDGTQYDLSSDSDVAASSALEDMRNSLSFSWEVGAIQLQDSGYTLNDKTGGTTLASNLKAEFLAGPLDIIVTNGGNGFTDGVPDAQLMISDYFEITDMNVDLDFLGVSVTGVRVHNHRGDTTGLNANNGGGGAWVEEGGQATESFGFAHLKLNLGRAEDVNDGLYMDLGLKGDIDIDSIQLGATTPSIGSIYITDLTLVTSVTVRGH